MPPVIVSLASYPPRIGSVQKCIESLLAQSAPPDKVLLWLYSGEFPEGIAELPSSLVDLQNDVFHIEWTDVNLKSHNKYFWVMQRFPDAIIVTTDDDIVYRPTMLEELLQAHREYPEAVVGNRTHIMLADERGILCPYDLWLKEQEVILHTPSSMVMATGVGGVLYPPHVLPNDTFDADRICELALRADDLWLKAMEIRAGVPTVATGLTALSYIPGTQDCGLWLTVNSQGGNDEALGLLASVLAGKADELRDEHIRNSFLIMRHYEHACQVRNELERENYALSEKVRFSQEENCALCEKIEKWRVERERLCAELDCLQSDVKRLQASRKKLIAARDRLKEKCKRLSQKNHVLRERIICYEEQLRDPYAVRLLGRVCRKVGRAFKR